MRNRIAFVVFLFTLVSCAAVAAAQRASKPATHTVTIDATSFQPTTLTIKAGDTVVWVNKDVMPHTATASAAKGFDSGVLLSGKSWKQVFKTKGTQPYVCIFHPTMKGKLVVK